METLKSSVSYLKFSYLIPTCCRNLHKSDLCWPFKGYGSNKSIDQNFNGWMVIVITIITMMHSWLDDSNMTLICLSILEHDQKKRHKRGLKMTHLISWYEYVNVHHIIIHYFFQIDLRYPMTDPVVWYIYVYMLAKLGFLLMVAVPPFIWHPYGSVMGKRIALW